ncbi:hypothetical protein ATCV1_Z012L [Acanthocystis turfacea chlorella virus 1]|uniref:Uncharacterized protein Z012L n=1 Tax=Chlorovirus heliozoae TaxID=322019 RepID=A7K7X2_9PHYC|nr:hypothetical protein ATCV1_Z012L [Acanthocystis turfacea chlorella virus 1]ABT16146.1 hypothetical protein ATCV1_Z012L [Acanthocystis turfacea chlorella virus 1]
MLASTSVRWCRILSPSRLQIHDQAPRWVPVVTFVSFVPGTPRGIKPPPPKSQPPYFQNHHVLLYKDQPFLQAACRMLQ